VGDLWGKVAGGVCFRVTGRVTEMPAGRACRAVGCWLLLPHGQRAPGPWDAIATWFTETPLKKKKKGQRRDKTRKKKTHENKKKYLKKKKNLAHRG